MIKVNRDLSQDILVVDDEKDIRSLVSSILEDEGYTTREAENSTTALEALAKRPPHVVILDIWLHGSELDGVGILKKIISDYPGIPVIMMSGHGTIETAVECLKIGAYDFIEKPVKLNHLLSSIQKAIENARLKRENEELKRISHQHIRLIGESPLIKKVKQSIQKVAPTMARVLISGASGSGKEIVARCIHDQSKRTKHPFVILNCANMDPSHVEVELFGLDPTAGNSAANDHRQRKVGILEKVHGGTLYLDEVSDMPLQTQGKFVRILQEHRFERVGGQQQVEVDVRVIASTSQNLLQLVKEKRFREDLYYRLNVVPIEVPSLTERVEDIMSLVTFFMEQFERVNGMKARKIHPDVVRMLESYGWPGQVRQLRNTIERILIMAPGSSQDMITVDMLPAEISGKSSTNDNFASANVISLPLKEARDAFERDYIAHQVKRFNGNISKTASFIGMERSALHRKIKKLTE